MSNIYEIAIKMTIAGNAQAALGILAADVVGLDHKVSGLIGKFKELGGAAKLALGGGVALAAGAGLAAGLDALASSGQNLIRIQERMKQAGATPQQIADAMAAAHAAAARYTNLSITDTAGLVNDLRMISGSQDLANQGLGSVAGVFSTLKWLAANGKMKGDPESVMNEAFAAAKSAEIAGEITPASATAYMQDLIAMRFAYGDLMKMQDFLGAQRLAGPAYFGLNDEGKAVFGAMTQELGSAAGAGLRQTFKKIVSGAGWSNASVETMSDLGLIVPGQAHWNSKIGKYDKISEAGIVGRDLFASNPLEWVDKVLMPKMQAYEDKKGITDPQQRQIDMMGVLQRILTNKNDAMFVATLMLQSHKLHKDAGLVDAARGVLGQSPITASFDYLNQSVDAQFKSVITDLGTSLTPLITSMKADLVPVLQAMDKLAQDKPLMEAIGKVAVAMSGALIVAGVTALGLAIGAMATPVVLAAAGVTALIGVIWAFRDAIKSAFDYLASFLPTGGHLSYATGSTTGTPALANPFKGKGGALPSIGEAGAYLDSLDAGNGMFPAPPPKNTNTNVFVYLDGKEVANRVVQRVVTGTTFTTGSAAFDGISHYGAR